MEFGEMLKEAMAEKNLTQAKVAELTGKSKASICQYLNGGQTPPKKSQASIAILLGLPQDYFFRDLVKLDGLADKNMTPEQAAKVLGVHVNTIRKGLQQGVFPWGYAVRTSEDRWTYIINARKFCEMERVAGA